MADLSKKGIKLTAKKFNIQRRLLAPASYLILLRRDGRINAFETPLLVLQKDFGAEWSDFRNAFVFEIARNETGFSEIIRKVTHLSFSGELYAALNQDEFPPYFTDFTWKISAQKVSGNYPLP